MFLSYPGLRVSQNFKSMEIWYFPHLMSVLGYSRIENHKDLACRVNGHRLHSTYLHFTKEITKKYKENFKKSVIWIFSRKLIHKFLNGLGLHSWDHYESFETHVAISKNYKCPMQYTSFMSKMPYLTHMPSDTCQI